jgi:uncharacterized protein YjbJ (UPF0337 family)
MTVALPARFSDVITSVASAGRDAADNLLHEASHVAEQAAEASSAKARNLFRNTGASRRPTRRGRGPKQLFGLLVIAGAVGATVVLRGRLRSTSTDVADGHAGASPEPSTHERNRALTGNSTDEVTARVEEAIGALTDNDDLRADGTHDTAAASSKRADDKAGDKVSEGIDALKDTFSNN